MLNAFTSSLTIHNCVIIMASAPPVVIKADSLICSQNSRRLTCNSAIALSGSYKSLLVL